MIRLARPEDCAELSRLRQALWPESSAEEHAVELGEILGGKPWSTLPYVIFVAETKDGIAGFAEVGLRSHADGCDVRRPVGYLEGWFVSETSRRRGIGRALLHHAEAWARAQGCLEMASDTWIDNEDSQRTHEALGFEVVDRCVNFRKAL